MSRNLTLLFAVAGGAAVGNLYWAQPLLGYIAAAFHISLTAAGLLVTVTQIGYALGVFLIVPLGDTVNRRRLIPALVLLSALALAASAAAPTFNLLLVALGTVGLSTVTGQLLIPMAGDIAQDAQRGRVIGIIASGQLIGILMSRMVSGFLADHFGWRAIYIAATLISVVIALLLARSIPVVAPRAQVPYGTLLRSVFVSVHQNRSVQATLVIGGAVFAVFTMFWTGLTFLLSGAPFSYSATQIGMVGLLGLAGAFAAKGAGRLHDRGLAIPATGGALLLALAALAIAACGTRSIIIIVIAVVVLQVAIQALNVLNQTRTLSADPHARSRLNTAFVTVNFIGGAMGSALSGALWLQGGWMMMMAGAAGLIVLALLAWMVGYRRAGTAASNKLA